MGGQCWCGAGGFPGTARKFEVGREVRGGALPRVEALARNFTVGRRVPLKKRHGILVKNMCGESRVVHKVVSDYCVAKLKSLLEECSLGHI